MPQLLHSGHIRHSKGTQRHAAHIVLLLQNLGTQAGHVDVGGTLTATAFAGQTTVQNLGQFFGLKDTFHCRKLRLAVR